MSRGIRRERLALFLRMIPTVVAWMASLTWSEFGPRPLLGRILLQSRRFRARGVEMSDRGADDVFVTALSGAFGDDFAARVRHPVASEARRSHRPGIVETIRVYLRYTSETSDISYGPHGVSNTLDVWLDPTRPPSAPAPVLLQIHGGAWAVGSKRGQAHPLMAKMVELGWICVTINYRKSPRNVWPAHVVDVKRAIAWVREHAAEFGGDPDFIALTGGSAGGHLTALAALTANEPAHQPGFEHADTTVQAAVPFYGVYDVTGAVPMQPLMGTFLEQFVMKCPQSVRPDVFASASPRVVATADAPPLLIVHGAGDSFIPVVQARAFHAAMREAGARDLAYAEMPRTEHAFDTLATVRTQNAVERVAQFLGIVYGMHRASRRDRSVG